MNILQRIKPPVNVLPCSQDNVVFFLRPFDILALVGLVFCTCYYRHGFYFSAKIKHLSQTSKRFAEFN